MRRLLSLILLALAPLAAAAQPVRLEAFSATPQTGRVRLEWRAASETGLVTYELFRRSPTTNGTFSLIASLRPSPTRAYEYVDEGLYKDAAAPLAEYRLEAVAAGGVRQSFPMLQVNYTTTSIRRTWGSIKAMFQ